MADVDAPLEPGYAPGTILAKRYRVESRIGAGGMGIVLKATQIDLDRLVALKLLLPEFRADLNVVERFFREAKAAARIQSEHVARILDIGSLESGEPFIAMEFLEGEDLGHLLERQGRLSVELATQYMLHTCAAVAEAHAARIVHRDLKPQNLFLARTPQGKSVLKVLDFGISRVDDAASHLTQTSSALGTAFYMAPEQITSPKMIDLRADIWSLGVVFYELVTGRMPFEGDTLPQVVAHVIKNERARASDVVAGIPLAVDEIIDRCLSQDPTARYQTAVELAVALANIGRNEEDALVVAHLQSLPPPPPSIATEAAPRARAPSYQELAETQAPVVPDLDLTRGKPAVSAPASGHSRAAAPTPRAPAQRQAARDFAFEPTQMQELELDQGPTARGAPMDYHAQHALHARRVARARRAREDDDDEDEPRRSPWRKLIVALVLIGLPPLAVFVVAPRVLTARIDSAAAHAGMKLTHDSPTLSLTGLELKNLHVTFDKAKDTVIQARSAHAAFAGDGLILSDVRVTSTTPADALVRALGDADAAIPWSVDVEGLSFAYTPQPDVAISCSGKFSTRIADSGRNVWLECAEAHVVTSRGEIGPFTISVDRTRGLWGGSVAVPDSSAGGVVPTASIVTSDQGAQLNAEIAHTTLEKLHVAPGYLNLPDKDNPEVDLKIEARADASGKVDGVGSIAIRDATLGATRLDATWDFSIAGDNDGVQAKNKSAKIGPFPAQITATWKKSAPLASSLSFRTTPYTCADLARARGKRAAKNAAAASILPGVTGVATETGDVHVGGAITMNLGADHAAAALESKLDADDTCGLLIFPRKL